MLIFCFFFFFFFFALRLITLKELNTVLFRFRQPYLPIYNLEFCHKTSKQILYCITIIEASDNVGETESLLTDELIL